MSLGCEENQKTLSGVPIPRPTNHTPLSVGTPSARVIDYRVSLHPLSPAGLLFLRHKRHPRAQRFRVRVGAGEDIEVARRDLHTIRRIVHGAMR